MVLIKKQALIYLNHRSLVFRELVLKKSYYPKLYIVILPKHILGIWIFR